MQTKQPHATRSVLCIIDSGVANGGKAAEAQTAAATHLTRMATRYTSVRLDPDQFVLADIIVKLYEITIISL